MNKVTATLALKFLQRIQLQATEVKAFVEVNQALLEIINEPQGDLESTAAAVASSLEGNGPIPREQDGGV